MGNCEILALIGRTFALRMCTDLMVLCMSVIMYCVQFKCVSSQMAHQRHQLNYGRYVVLELLVSSRIEANA